LKEDSREGGVPPRGVGGGKKFFENGAEYLQTVKRWEKKNVGDNRRGGKTQVKSEVKG